MKIGICDDQKIVADKLLKDVEEIVAQKGIDAECRVFYSASKLIEEIEAYSIVFLDIEMPEIDGIEAGKIIKKINPKCKIVMATARIERVAESFHFQAFRFVRKPFVIEELEEALVNATREVLGETEIELFLDWNSHMIKQKDICFIIAFNGYSEYHVGKQVFRKDTSLKNAEKELDPRLFCRINRECIVNLGKIEETGDAELIVCGVKISISKRRKTEFLKSYIEYDINYR